MIRGDGFRSDFEVTGADHEFAADRLAFTVAEQGAEFRRVLLDCLKAGFFPFQFRGDSGVGVGFFQRGHDPAVESVDLLRLVRPDEDAVVLQEEHVRALAFFRLVAGHFVTDLFGERVARVGVVDPERIGEEFRTGFPAFHGAGHAVHQRGMEVHHIGKREQFMQRGFHRGTAAGTDRVHHHLFRRGFAFGHV